MSHERPQAALRITGLVKSFGDVHAIRGIDLCLEAGEFVTLLGPSGCGKSTTLRVVAGLEEPTRGRVELFGSPVADTEGGTFVPANQRNLGMVFQSYALWPHMTAVQNVAFPLRNGRGKKGEAGGKVSGKQAHELAMRSLSLVKCDHLHDRYPGEMSGGQQQRIALARSIVHSPPLVLLDEPLSNLDASLRRDLRLELRRLQEDVGFAALYVTHDQAEALSMSDRVVLMNEGVIEQVATPERLFEFPGTSYAARFIGDHNVLAGEIVHCAGGLATLDTPIGAVQARASRDEVVPRVGASGMVAVRTDRIRLRTAAGDDPAGGARGVVVGSAYNGAYVDVVVEVADGREVMVRDYSGARPPARGAAVSFELATEAVLTDVSPAQASPAQASPAQA